MLSLALHTPIRDTSVAVLGTHRAKPAMCLFFLSSCTICPFLVPSISPLERDSKPYCGISSFLPTLDAADQVLLKHKVNSHLSTFIQLEYGDCKYTKHVHVAHLSSPTRAPYLPFNPSITDQ